MSIRDKQIAVDGLLHEISKFFPTGAKMTLVVRSFPGNCEGDLMLTDDDPEEVIKSIRIRAEAGKELSKGDII